MLHHLQVLHHQVDIETVSLGDRQWSWRVQAVNADSGQRLELTAAQAGLVHSTELAAFEAALDAAYGALAGT